MSLIKITVILIVIFISGCCGDYQLITFGRYGESTPDDLIWKKERESHLPRNQLEEHVVGVAANHRAAGDGNVMIVFVTRDNDDILVAAVENTAKNGSRFEPKKVMRYIVEKGRIKATMGPTIEPFPDVALERAALLAVHKAITEGGWAVVPVLNWIQPVAVKATTVGPCFVEVKFFEMNYGGPGNYICSKTMNPCPL